MKKRVLFSVTPLLLGILLLVNVMSNPRFETYRGADVVKLLGVGALLVVGLARLWGEVKTPGE
ncbi:MAG TPA: hypothetical protein VH639_01930 [Bryobacteraceae bacterium]|jgi:hypothetical protein